MSETVSNLDYEEMRQRAIRAENALRDIRTLAENSLFGSWRFKVAEIVDRALKR